MKSVQVLHLSTVNPHVTSVLDSAKVGGWGLGAGGWGLGATQLHTTRPISVDRFPRRALTLCPQLCTGIQPGARFPACSAYALPATLYGHFLRRYTEIGLLIPVFKARGSALETKIRSTAFKFVSNFHLRPFAEYAATLVHVVGRRSLTVSETRVECACGFSA